jgi:hypothetical protein
MACRYGTDRFGQATQHRSRLIYNVDVVSESEAALVLDESRSVRLSGGWRPSRNCAAAILRVASMRQRTFASMTGYPLILIGRSRYPRRLSKVGYLVQLHNAMIVHRGAA